MSRVASTCSVLGLASLLGFSACSGEGNTGRTEIGDALAAAVPWVKGRPPVISPDGTVLVPREPVYPPIATGKEDPGSGPYTCDALAGLEFSTDHWYETFEADRLTPSAFGVAERWSTYDDSSDGVFRVPGEITLYEGLAGRHSAAWGLPAERVEGAPSCNGERNDWVLHFRGGRFNRFGGGMGHPLAQVCELNPAHELCARTVEEGASVDNAGFPLGPAGGGNYNPPTHSFVDISQYDGISFWARRGPESEAYIGVVVFDKYTSDDLNRQNQTYCRRLKECRTQCLNREPCSETGETSNAGNAIYRCYDPEKVDLTYVPPLLLEEVFPRCGASACTFVSTYPDPEFEGKACRPYTFQTNESAEFCWDEGDPPPPETSQRCGDGYGYQLNITKDWKFYKIPFSEMRQYGHGKVSPRFDLTTVSGIAVVTAKGWMDLYLDNVSFYREAD
jgi:hypothetical protein